jgi:hypothetical protein
MCKENAALLPLSILLVEFIFFRDCRDPREIRLLVLLLATTAVAVIALGTVAFGNPFGFLNGYPNRTFTPLQRLLTESRVLVQYLSQIFYPVPTRLSLYHDVTVSTSLLFDHFIAHRSWTQMDDDPAASEFCCPVFFRQSFD